MEAVSPDSFFINKKGEILKRFTSKHTSLGVLAKEDFSTDTELLQWQEAGHVASYSDGLLEAFNRQGEDFSTKAVSAFSTPLASPEDDRLQIVVDQLKKHLDGEPAHDDISIVVIECNT